MIFSVMNGRCIGNFLIGLKPSSSLSNNHYRKVTAFHEDQIYLLVLLK